MSPAQIAKLRWMVHRGPLTWSDIEGYEANTMRSLVRRGLAAYAHDWIKGERGRVAAPGTYRWEATAIGRGWVAGYDVGRGA